jgi:hypothetical protein
MEFALFLQVLLAADAQPTLQFSTVEVQLPGGNEEVSLDYLAAERTAGRVWIPAGNTASVDVLDVAKKKVTRIEGFAVGERSMRGKKRMLGPSAVSLGDGKAFIGNRATRELCTVDARQLTKLACTKLSVATDGVQYVAATKEVWVTTPADDSITVVDVADASQPRQTARIALAGESEGYAVDEGRGLFFTNLEDRDRTLAIDVRSRKVVKSWDARCGRDGPRGLAYDTARELLFVACTDHVEVLDAAHDGKILSTLQTGAGVDNIDYLDRQQRLYVAAGRAARLTVAHVGPDGKLVALGSAATTPGARVVVVTGDGVAVIGDPAHGGVLLLTPQP